MLAAEGRGAWATEVLSHVLFLSTPVAICYASRLAEKLSASARSFGRTNTASCSEPVPEAAGVATPAPQTSASLASLRTEEDHLQHGNEMFARKSEVSALTVDEDEDDDGLDFCLITPDQALGVLGVGPQYSKVYLNGLPFVSDAADGKVLSIEDCAHRLHLITSTRSRMPGCSSGSHLSSRHTSPHTALTPVLHRSSEGSSDGSSDCSTSTSVRSRCSSMNSEASSGRPEGWHATSSTGCSPSARSSLDMDSEHAQHSRRAACAPSPPCEGGSSTAGVRDGSDCAEGLPQQGAAPQAQWEAEAAQHTGGQGVSGQLAASPTASCFSSYDEGDASSGSEASSVAGRSPHRSSSQQAMQAGTSSGGKAPALPRPWLPSGTKCTWATVPVALSAHAPSTGPAGATRSRSAGLDAQGPVTTRSCQLPSAASCPAPLASRPGIGRHASSRQAAPAADAAAAVRAKAPALPLPDAGSLPESVPPALRWWQVQTNALAAGRAEGSGSGRGRDESPVRAQLAAGGSGGGSSMERARRGFVRMTVEQLQSRHSVVLCHVTPHAASHVALKKPWRAGSSRH